MDTALNGYFIRDYWKFQTYPFCAQAITIVSLKESTSYVDAFVLILIVKAFLLFIASCIPYIISLKYILKVPMSMAALEFVRLLTGTANTKQSQAWFGRLILLALTICTFVISTFMQSYFSAISTVGYRGPTIDSANDFIHSTHQLYGQQAHKELILQKDIRDRYNYDSYFGECAMRLSQGHRVACIYQKVFLKLFFEESERIHISKNNLIERSFAYTYAEDFPFISKLSWILLKLNQGGIIVFSYDRYDRELLRKLKKSDGDDAGKSLNVNDLIGNLHIILIISWISASFAFLVEIALHKIEPFTLRHREFFWAKYTFSRSNR